MHGGVAPAAAMLFACIDSYAKKRNFEGEGCCFVQYANYASLQDYLASSDPHVLDARYPMDVELVRAVDMKGRLNPAGLARFWTQLRTKHPFGFLRATNILSIACAPNIPRPAPPYGSALDELTPLIIGEFGDPSTTYTAAQVMQSNFKNGVLLSWQGYKHGMAMNDGLADSSSFQFLNGGYGVAECTKKMAEYLETAKLPLNGDICPINGPAASALDLRTAMAADERNEDATHAYCLGAYSYAKKIIRPSPPSSPMTPGL